MMDWDKIYREHYDRVFRTLYGRTSGDKELALDLTHDVFVRAMRFEHQWRYDDGRGIGPWLTTIAVNLLRDHFKSGRLRFEWPTADMPEADWDLPSAEDEALDDLTARTIMRAVGALDASQREAVVLSYWGRWSDRQIAAHVGSRPNTVAVRRWRAREILRRSLAGVA